MKRQALAVFVIVLGLIGATAAFLGTQESRQKLGKPGLLVVPEPIYAVDIGASTNAPVLVSSNQVFLPPRVLNYRSQAMPVQSLTVNTLPKDTVYGHRMYAHPSGLLIDYQVVLMGADRSSIHRPQHCLRGSGFETLDTQPATIRIDRPHAYDLPVMKLKLHRFIEENGVTRRQGGVLVYWFVADGELTAQHRERMWWMARDMVKTGVLQRWAYVICFAPCEPGAEDVTYERVREFIAASVPEFHLTTGRPINSERAAR